MLVSTPWTTLPGDERHARLADREDVDPRLPGQARLDRDPGILLEPVRQVGRDGQADPGPEDAVDLGQGDVDHPARLDPGDPDRAPRADALAVAEVDVDLAAVRQEARPAAGQAEQAHQGRQRQDDHQADADLASRGSSIHRDSLPWGARLGLGRILGPGTLVRSQDPIETSAGSLILDRKREIPGPPTHPSAASGPSGRTPARRGRRAGTRRR